MKQADPGNSYHRPAGILVFLPVPHQPTLHCLQVSTWYLTSTILLLLTKRELNVSVIQQWNLCTGRTHRSIIKAKKRVNKLVHDTWSSLSSWVIQPHQKLLLILQPKGSSTLPKILPLESILCHFNPFHVFKICCVRTILILQSIYALASACIHVSLCEASQPKFHIHSYFLSSSPFQF
jgi:hypothetical protein